jgi:hypothetical protein
MATEDFPAPSDGFVLTHFIEVEHVALSREFYAGALGATVLLDGEPTKRQAGQQLDHQRGRRADRRQARCHTGAATGSRQRKRLPQHPGG